MTGEEIFTCINEKRKEIEELSDPATFMLNSKVLQLQKEVEVLQTICPHLFNKHGVCEYCGKEKNQWNK